MDWSARTDPLPFEEARRLFFAASAGFRAWAKEQTQTPPGEWELLYEDWNELNRAFVMLLASSDPAEWNVRTVDEALYVLARDNGPEILKDDLLGFPHHLFALAKAGLDFDDPQARWQLADVLASPDLPGAEAEPLIERFVQDDDEYVSRRALLALARRGSPQTERLAASAWDTGHEYQRIAALYALSACGSPRLGTYLDLAEADGRDNLVANVRRLREAGEG